MSLYEYRVPYRNENRIELRKSESQVRSCWGRWRRKALSCFRFRE